MLSSPSTSPPRTPDERHLSALSKATTPNSDDSSIIDDLSFDYIQDPDGNIVRLSKGSSLKSNHSSPPTPQESPLQPDPPPPVCDPDSPDLLASPITRISLSRSESAYPVLTGVSASSQNDKPARSFHRVASGPAISMTPSYLAPTASSLSKPRVTARRTTMEDTRERERHDSVGASKATRQTLDSYAMQEEKENISESDDHPYIQTASVATKQRSSPPLVTRSISASSSRISSSARAAYLANGTSANSRPLAEVSLAQRAASSHSRQILSGTNRPGRIMKSSSSKYSSSASAPNFDRISEVESSDNEYARYSPVVSATGGDDTEPEDEPLPAVDPAMVPLPPSLPTGAHAGIMRSRTPSGLNVNTSLALSGSSRPRRSASLSDALNNDDYQLQLQQQYQNPSNPNSRPGTSMGANDTAGARRVTTQERERQDVEYKKYRSQDELERRGESAYQQARQSPSPTHSQAARPGYAHRRRDSDTLRSAGLTVGSPTVINSQRGSPPLGSRLQVRYSPPAASKGRTSPPSSAKGRLSPPGTAKGRTSPSGAKGRLSPAGREIAKHRRSPTAPESSTTSGLMREGTVPAPPAGKTWAGAERGEKEDEYEYGGAVSSGERERERERDREKEREREREREKDRERQRKWQQLQQLQQQQQQQYAQSAPAIPQASASVAPPPPAQLNRHIVVNKKAYARLDMIGKGGSSRVFRVLNHVNELFAIKRVSLDKTDSETMNGYMNEIALLKRLEGNSRIIRLIDSEVKPGPGGSKGHLLLVMECGEIDLARLLQEQMREPVNMVWVAYYWQQMLQAVHVIHEEKIVHSDLKPANFVLVRGQLKLIDFGIANAIANDTTNIQRDHQVGTVNYMSPEAIELPDGMRRLKVGRASDVWSLGCILYQMIYGHPPFQHLSSVYHKMRAIPDMTHVIEFAEYTTPTMPSPRTSTGSTSGQVEPPKKLHHLRQRVRKDVMTSMKSCLCRNAKERATIPDLLDHGWLAKPESSSEPPAKELLKENEAIINPYYMQQLLEYGIKLASEGGIDAQSLLKDAERLVQELKSIQP